jgi:hypothetical protein
VEVALLNAPAIAESQVAVQGMTQPIANAPSICAQMAFGLIVTLQSTAHHTLWTRGSPSARRDTCAICAT